GDIRLVVRDRVERRDHVLEALRSAEVRHPPAEPRLPLLQEVAVAWKPPHPSVDSERERLPSEHRAVEGPGAVRVASIEAVEVQGTRFVDDLSAPVGLGL